MVKLTIDGVEVSVEKGATILEATQQAGIRIPTLCHDKRLIPYGGCRLCVVEVTQRGKTKTIPACFNPAKEGMEVATHTPALETMRRMQLALLLRSHPLLCSSCDAAGKCDLQDLVHEYKVGDLPFDREARFFHVDNDSPFIRHNMNLCIRCGMCVRICDEVQGQNEISMILRGKESEVSTDFGRPLNCEFCGQCAGICPTGAIRSKWLVGTGRDFELIREDTTCAFCSLGCTLTLGRKDNNVVYVTSPVEAPNEGNLCVKGRYGWPYLYSGRRLDKPTKRTDSTVTELDWDDALNEVAVGFQKALAEHGPDSVGVLGSERLTNEEAYLLNKFTRSVMGVANLDHAGGYGYAALVKALQPSLGYPAGTNPIRDLRSSEVILLVGADLTETHPVAKNEIILATGRHKATAIVIDPVRTRLTDRKGMFLNCKPGTEHILLNGMARSIIDRELYDKTFVDQKVAGFEDLKASLSAYDLKSVAELSTVEVEQIEKAAKTFAETKKGAIVLTQGMMNLTGSVEAARAAVNLALLTNNLGRPDCGIHVFGEKANFQGAVDMGLTPDSLPGFISIDDEAVAKKFSEAWGDSTPKKAGLSAREIIEKAAQGIVKALYIVGENPIETYPDRALVEKALTQVEFLVVQDMFPSATTEFAHVVLPAAAFAEKSGTFTNAERRVQPLNPILRLSAGRPDLDIISALAAKMGATWTATTYATVMDEIAGLVDVYKGITYDRLTTRELMWPCVDAEDPGTAVLYQGGFPKGKANFATVSAPSAPVHDKALYLVPAALKFHSGSFSLWSESLMEVCPDGAIEMNAEDMKSLGLNDGETVRISSETGVGATAPVRTSKRACRGCVIMPFHFPHLKANAFIKWDQQTPRVKVEKAS